MIKGQSIALPVDEVVEMLPLPPVHEVVGYPKWVRGVFNLRGQVLALIDLRVRLGMGSATKEVDQFCTLMHQREDDHRRWLAELDASVREKREFKLQKDPHKCAFGLWYDTYKPANVMASIVLKKFDRPHKAIHALAGKVRDLVDEGKADLALQIIDRAREGVLVEMVRLFDSLRQTMQCTRREVVVVMEGERQKYGVCVDEVEALEPLAAESLQSVANFSVAGEAHCLATGVARRAKSDGLALVLDTKELVRGM